MNTAPPAPPAPRPTKESRGVSPAVIVGVVALVVALVAVLAIVLTGGDDSEGDAGGTAVLAVGAPGAGPAIGEFLEVTPVGEILTPFEPGPNDPAVGLAAPVITGQAFDGTPLTLGGPTDGPTLLVFLAHWCPHCNDEIPELNELRDAGTLPPELNVIGIATGSNEQAPNFPPSQWAADKNWTWPMLVDDEFGTSMGYMGGTSFPFVVMLDSNGDVLARKSGSSDAATTLAWIEATLA